MSICGSAPIDRKGDRSNARRGTLPGDPGSDASMDRGGCRHGREGPAGHGAGGRGPRTYVPAELEPTNAKAHFNLGNVLHDRSEYQAALILYRNAAALDPQFADAHFDLALTCE